MTLGVDREKFTERFHELRKLFPADNGGYYSRRHVILLSHEYLVSPRQCCELLTELGLVKPGGWDWFLRNGGITQAQMVEVLRGT